MERLRTLWRGGVGGKVLIIAGGVMGLLVVCCVGSLALGAVISSNRNPASSTPSAQAAAPTELPTVTPSPSVMSVSTAQPIQAATEVETSPETRYLEIAQKGAIPVARGDLPKGEWGAVTQNLGDGPEVHVTFPMSVGFSSEQTVRLGKVQAAGIVKRLFDADSALVAVVVSGTLPAGVKEIEVLLIRVPREAFARWDGTAETLGNWRISQQLIK